MTLERYNQLEEECVALREALEEIRKLQEANSRLAESHKNNFVLKPWVAGVGLKMQSILLSGLRAPDVKAPNVKKCVRWLRSQCQIDADPAKQSYMQTITMNPQLIDDALDELEYCSCHYTHHFADSFRVLALFHCDEAVKGWASTIHNSVAEEIFHFKPETDYEFIERHKDKR